MTEKQTLRSPSRSRFPAPPGFARAAALCLLAASATACGNKATPTPDKEPPPPNAQPSAAIVAPTANAAKEEPPVIPMLTHEKFEPASGAHVYAVEGAIMVAEGVRLGRIVDEKVEWLPKKLPESAFGSPNTIDSVHGRWPDSIGVVFSNTNGRASQPAYYPMTGAGMEYVSTPGSGLGQIYGVARLGATTLVGARTHGGVEFAAVRGVVARKPQTPEQAGCKAGEVSEFNPSPIGVTPTGIESTPDGSLVSIGTLCEKRGVAAEVWDKNGKSRIIDLSRWWKKLNYKVTLLKGDGDELWAYSDRWAPVLHYRDGEFEAVPTLEWPIQAVFVSTRGVLHANDGTMLFRYEGGKWTPIGQLAKPDSISTIAMDEKGTIWVGGVYRLRPGPGAGGAREACKTHFVHLYEVSWKNDNKFTYPATRKALSTFSEVADLGLVEFGERYDRRLGITVKSRTQGEAVMTHLKETMKDEAPMLTCFEPGKNARKIDMNAKK
jgi:hypothetical protein